MKNTIISWRDRLRASYWFIPMVMAVLAFLLSIIAIQIDERIGLRFAWISGLVYVDSPEGARTLLSTIASSMITVAGVVFSLTMVVLSLTSQQYGPLVLSNFMRDRGNQFVLGIFTATFIYCLLVLRTIRGVGSSIFIPHFSVLIGLGLGIAGLAVLIYFIHHVSDSIRASTIIDRISDDLNQAIIDLFPVQLGARREEAQPDNGFQELPENFESQSKPIFSDESGYLQLVDSDTLLDAARDHDVIIHLIHRPGHYIIKGSLLATAWPLERVTERLDRRVNNALVLGSHRTQVQDVEYLFTQLVGVGVRALSQAINDPFTAVACIEHLGEALCLLGNRQTPSRYRYDQDGNLRVILNSVTFGGMLALSFDEIWHYGREDPRVRQTLQRTLQMIAQCVGDETNRGVVLRYAERYPQAEQVVGV